MSYLPAGQSETRVLASRIPVIDASDGAGSSLLVRIHNARIDAGGGTPGSIAVWLIDDASTPQDANHIFLASQAITGASVTLNSSSGVGDFTRTEITGNMGSMAALAIVGTQDSTNSGLPLMAEISVDLILKAG